MARRGLWILRRGWLGGIVFLGIFGRLCILVEEEAFRLVCVLVSPCLVMRGGLCEEERFRRWLLARDLEVVMPLE